MESIIKLLKKKEVSEKESDAIYNLINDSKDEKIQALTFVFEKLADWRVSALYTYDYHLFESKKGYLKYRESIKDLLIKVLGCRRKTIEQMIENFELYYYQGVNLAFDDDEDGEVNISQEDIDEILKQIEILVRYRDDT